MPKRRVGLYSPYIPKHLGGGERYLLSVAEYFSHSCETVVLVREKIDEAAVRKTYEDTFHLNLSQVKFEHTSLGTNASALQKLIETSKLDLLYYLTDGSLFFSLAHKNILHLQFPFTFRQQGLMNRLKLANWSVKNANSQFTRDIVQRAWHTKIKFVHEPFVDAELFKPANKEQTILSVGRFFSGEKSGLHCKRQDILVESFRRLVAQGLRGWRLVLIGSVDPGQDNEQYARAVDEAAKGLPIKIFHDASFDLLRRYYAAASIYWHAAGFGVDENKEPLKVEHFGISTLEAMASGAVPVVVGKGGQKEIVEPGKNGFLWQTQDELERYTMELIEHEAKRHEFAVAARTRAMVFSKARFEKTLEEMSR